MLRVRLESFPPVTWGEATCLTYRSLQGLEDDWFHCLWVGHTMWAWNKLCLQRRGLDSTSCFYWLFGRHSWSINANNSRPTTLSWSFAITIVTEEILSRHIEDILPNEVISTTDDRYLCYLVRWKGRLNPTAAAQAAFTWGVPYSPFTRGECFRPGETWWGSNQDLEGVFEWEKNCLSWIWLELGVVFFYY